MSNQKRVKEEKKAQNDDSSEYAEWAQKLVERATPQIGVLQNTTGTPVFGQQPLTNEGIPANWGYTR